MENYEILRKLGAGNFAKVYLALHTPTGRKVALKIIDKQGVPSARKLIHKVRREINNMRKLRHRNIVEIYESFESRSQFVIAMEYLPNGELFDYVWERQGLRETEAREMFTRIVEGVHHCHMNSIVHRDLKLENILLDANKLPKLADFGFSKEVEANQFLETYCGSSLYASPEMILGRPYFGTECDVWSLGVILYTMLTATMPFDDRNVPIFLRCIENGVYPDPSNVSEMAKDLLSRMLDPSPLSRVSIEDILSHPWMMDPLARNPPKSILKSTTGHSQAQRCSCDQPSKETVVRAEKTKVLRKNSSGCSSGYSSDSSSIPTSPLPSKMPSPTPGTTGSVKEQSTSTKFLSRFHFSFRAFAS